MANALLDPVIAQLTSQLNEMKARILQLERNQRSGYNIQNTAIENDNLTVNDANGNPAVVVGLLPDGTFGVTGVGSAVPSQAPDPPIVLPQLNSLMVVWDGLMNGGQPPLNFALVQVHCSTDPNFVPGPATLQGSIPSAGSYTVNGLTAGTTYYVALVGANQQGNTGPASASISGVPVAVAQMITAQQITSQMLAANLIYAGIVNGTLISGAQFVADGVSGEFLVYNGPAGYGNMIGSWSGSGGTDQFNNPYPVGLNVSVGSISGSIFSGLNFVLNQNGLFFYSSTAVPIALVQGPSTGTGNLNYTAATSPVTINLGSMNPTQKGNTVFMVIMSYTTGLFTTGGVSAKMTQSGAAMVRLAHIPFNSGGGGTPPTAVGWLDVWVSYNTPGGDTGITWTTNTNTGSAPLAYLRYFYEFSGLGSNPSVDVIASGYNITGTATSWTSGVGATTAPTELWIGGVAAYYNPSATPPTITGPGGFTNAAQLGGQIDGYASSMNLMMGYEIVSTTGNMVYSGSFSAAENWGAFAIGIIPSTPPGSGNLALALSAVSGSDASGNQFPIGYMGKTTAIQPGSSPVLPEVWHSMGTLPSGLVAGTARYKLIAEANCVMIDINVQFPATATTYSFPVLPAAFQPSSPSVARIWANQGNAGVTAAGQVPRFFYQSGGFQLIVSGGGAGTACLCVILPLN